MRVAVFGAGGVGGYFGARLLAAGNDVTFIARGEHLRVMQQRGLEVKSPLGSLQFGSVNATDDPVSIGTVDLVLCTVKLYDTESAAIASKRLIGDSTSVLTLQNGIDGPDILGKHLGPDTVVGGIAYIFADIEAPGVINHRGEIAKLEFGEMRSTDSSRVQQIHHVFSQANIDSHPEQAIDVRIWEKFVLLASLSGVTTVTRLAVGSIMGDSAARQLLHDAMQEVACIGKLKCPDLAEDIAQKQFDFVATLPGSMRSSMLNDIERGKKLELDFLSGTVVRLGKELGVHTPAHTVIYQALHPYLNGGSASKN